MTTDRAASVLARLKNKAKENGISFQQCLQLFFQEEFLRKLSASRYKDNLILKGGLFIYTLTNFESRATVDVDFMLRGLSNDMAHMDEIITEILAIPTGNDFVIFKALPTEPIAANRKYHGVSTQITGYIKNVRVPFSVDIGVGSTIAEKLDAILQRFELTGRMKDFYDIYYLSQTFDFDGLKLQTAIAETLQNRGTDYNADSFKRITELIDDVNMQIRWKHFLKSLHDPDIPFSKVMDGIAKFIEPVWDAFLKEDEFQEQWSADQETWN